MCVYCTVQRALGSGLRNDSENFRRSCLGDYESAEVQVCRWLFLD